MQRDTAVAAPVAGKGVGIVFGAVLCLGLLLLVIAATIVISLISVFIPNTSQQQYGEEYRVNALVLRSTFDNTTYTFSNSTVADSTAVSSACGTTLTNSGQSNVAGCLVTGNLGTGPVATGNRRRRRAVSVYLYTVGLARVFYSTPCSKLADKGKYSNSTGLSTCVSKRLAACNSVFNNKGSTYTQWTLTSGTVLSAVDITFSGYIKLTISAIFGVPASVALSLASTLGLSSSSQSYLSAGCQYIGPLSLSSINTILAAQSSLTTTQPSSTQATG